MLMKEIINQIDDVVLESEIEVLQTMSDVYDKAQLILENSDGTEDLVSSYTFFQEGEIMDQATGKGKDESAIKKIAAFLPRLIMAIVDFIKKKFSNKREKPSKVTYTKESFEKLAKDIKENGINSPWVKGLIAAGAATVTIGAGGAIIVKMKRHNKDNDGNNNENDDTEIVINPPDKAGQQDETPQPEQQQREQQQQPEQQVKQTASVQIHDCPWADYTRIFTDFTNSLHNNSQDVITNAQNIGKIFSKLITEWNELRSPKSKKAYNSTDERDEAKNEFFGLLQDRTCKELESFAKKITEASNQSNGDNNVIATLNKYCRTPLNNVMKSLQGVYGSENSIHNVLDTLNLTFTKLMNPPPNKTNNSNQPQTTNISDDEKRIAHILATVEEPDEKSLGGTKVHYSTASFNLANSIDITAAGSFRNAEIVLFGDGAVYVTPSAYTVNNLPEILNSFFTISPDDGINHQQGGNRSIENGYKITSVVPAVIPPSNDGKVLKLDPGKIQKGSITLSKRT